ncbi:MAG: hypothetical protein M3Q50_13365 [Chloroflexota bacterium]|nr:hypothetical protein [Chloroflexia bacterium]MDQ3227604.1 hypothetical protein [Chloroflexota bacterium]
MDNLNYATSLVDYRDHGRSRRRDDSGESGGWRRTYYFDRRRSPGLVRADKDSRAAGVGRFSKIASCSRADELQPSQRSSGGSIAMSRRAPGRAARQILSGSDLARPPDSGAGRGADQQPISLTFLYLVSLAVLVIASALVWVIWGMSAASAVLFVLALGLIASWLVV